jgi:hypothetical protein
MRAAIEMVRCNGMAKAKAAKSFGVPHTTFFDKLADYVPEEATRPGPPSVLSPAEEKTLIRYPDLMAQIGTRVLFTIKFPLVIIMSITIIVHS